VTSECRSAERVGPEVIRKKGSLAQGSVDAVNVTDNQTSIVRMSSLSSCLILKEMGFDPIWQVVCRDRNRIAIQSDILGAAALGINNILCLSATTRASATTRKAKNVYDIDSIQLIHTVRRCATKASSSAARREGKAEPVHRRRGESVRRSFEIRAMRLGRR